jgi:hypothetical protein
VCLAGDSSVLCSDADAASAEQDRE